MSKKILSQFLSAVFISFTIFLCGCSSVDYPYLATVQNVDINRYIGKWYEVARLPFKQQEGCTCTSAEYTIIDSTTLSVINECIKDGELDDAEGKAFVVEGSNNSKLKVQFFWPFRGDYWIIELDEQNYQYVVVGTPSRKYLWILSRTPKMEDELFKTLVDKSKLKGFDMSRLEITDQGCGK